jgi:hypothetical protein
MKLVGVVVVLIAGAACSEARRADTGLPDTEAAETAETAETDVPPGALQLNEVLAKNVDGVTDEHGDAEDWIELRNGTAAMIDLAGYWLSDDPDATSGWRFEGATPVAPGAYLLVWADGDTDDGPLHADFGLDAGGETIVLGAPNGSVVDTTTTGTLEADVSWARRPDGGETWSLATPTPGDQNPR